MLQGVAGAPAYSAHDAARQASHDQGPGPRAIIDALSIRERPPEAADRAVPGHWEGDLLAGEKNTHLATLVERRPRLTMLVKVAGKDATTVERALRRRIRALPKELHATLTWDRGTELALHTRFAVATNVQVYFCDPRSPWQRGTNENTNGLLRRYLPKDSDLSRHSQRQLNAIAGRLNGRPRKRSATGPRPRSWSETSRRRVRCPAHGHR